MNRVKEILKFIIMVSICLLMVYFISLNIHKLIPSYNNETLQYDNIYAQITPRNKILEYTMLSTRRRVTDEVEIHKYYNQNEIIKNLLAYKEKTDEKYKDTVEMIEGTKFGDLIYISRDYYAENFYTSTKNDNYVKRSKKMDMIFSKDYKNIYYRDYQSDNYYDTNKQESWENKEQNDAKNDWIITKTKEVINELKMDPYFKFEPNSIWRKNQTDIYVGEDTKNNIVVYYNLQTNSMTELAIGFVEELPIEE